MSKRDIVVIGSSAGGVYALRELVSGLPANFTASVFIIQHIAAFSPSMLPEILSRSGRLDARHPQDGETIQPATIYIAPPDHHMLIEGDHIVVRKGPKENRFRPSIDALFRSAAYNYGTRVIGIVLTGLLNDGTSGMWTVKRLGGLTLVQQPGDALYPSMPESVLEYVDVDHILPLADMALLLGQLTHEKAPEPITTPVIDHEMAQLKAEVATAAQTSAFEQGILSLGQLTPLTCPECHGALVSFQEGKLIRYRCHTGHAFTADGLLSEVTQSIEDTLWQAVRGIEESIMLLEQASTQLIAAGHTDTAEQYRAKAAEATHRAARIREQIFSQEQLATTDAYTDEAV